MKPVEEIIGDKILELLHLGLSIIVKPDITIDKVTELDENQIKEIKQKYGIEGIRLDVDETLRKDMKAIPEVNQQWIENLRTQLKIIIVSNGIDKKMEAYFKERGITYISFAHKPLKMNFLKAWQEKNVQQNKQLLITDSLFDDVLGGKRNNMKTALVKNVEDGER